MPHVTFYYSSLWHSIVISYQCQLSLPFQCLKVEHVQTIGM